MNDKSIILLHLAAAILYSSYWITKDRREGLYRLTVVLFLPITGFLLFFFQWLWAKHSQQRVTAVDPTDEATSQSTKQHTPKRVDTCRNEWIIPVQEALILNHPHVRRRLLLDILKRDLSKYPALLKAALTDQDSETSHYASTGVVELKRRLTLALQTWSDRYESGQRDYSSLAAYIEVMREYLQCGLFDTTSCKRLQEVYGKVLKELLKDPAKEEKHFMEQIDWELQSGDYAAARESCAKFLQLYKDSEKPYLMFLKLYYAMMDKEHFDEMLQALAALPVSLSESARSILGFWTEARAGRTP